MKFLRILLFASLGLVVLLLIGAGIGMTPGFQTWLARRVIAKQPDMKADIGRVAIGLSQVELTAIRIARPGLLLTLPAATVDVSVMQAAAGKIAVKRLKAHGFTLDLTAPQKLSGLTAPGRRDLAGYFAVLSTTHAAPGEKSAAFKGIFDQLKLPVELSVGELDLAGDVIFPAAGGKPARAKIVLTGGQLAAGQDGKLTLQAEAALSGAVTSLSSKGTIGIHMDTPSSIDRITVLNDLTASGESIPNGAKLQAELKAGRDAQGGEGYSLVLRSDGKTLADVVATLAAGDGKLAGTIKVAARDRDLAPFALGQAVPEFDATADSSFEVDTSFTQFNVNGTLELSLDKLAVVQKELAAIGPLRVSANYAVEQADGFVRVRALRARVEGTADAAALVEVRQPFDYNLASGELRMADNRRELIALGLQSLPLSWAQPFLGALRLNGGQASGAYLVTAAASGFSVRPDGPLTVSPVSIFRDGQPLVHELSLSVAASADVTPRGWQAEIGNLTARSGPGTLVTLTAKAGQVIGDGQPLKATGAFTVDLPGVLAQPVAGAAADLTGGTITGNFTASSGEAQEVAAQLVFSGLTARALQGNLPKVSVDVRASRDAAGSFVAQVPLLVELAGRKSDLAFDAKGRVTDAGVDLDARMTSTLIHADDMKILLAPFAGGEQPVRQTPQFGPDAKPAWSGVTGKLTFGLKEVVYSPELTVRDLNGMLSIADAAVTLQALKAILGPGGQLSLSGGLTFVPATPKPYALKADFSVVNLDSGATLKAFDLSPAMPLVEGRFDLSTKVQASGANLASLADQASGDVKVSSNGGLFRPIPTNYLAAITSARTELLKRTEQVGAISSLAGALGAKLPGNLGGATAKAQALAERLGRLESIVKLISEIKFDQLTLDAGSSTTLDTVLRDLTITSPELRFVGAGGLKYQPGVPLWKQAMSLKLNGFARGGTAELMKKSDLLGEKEDSLGYFPLSLAVNIDGTAEKPDTSRLVSALLEKVLSLKLDAAGIERLRQGDLGTILNVLTQLK